VVVLFVGVVNVVAVVAMVGPNLTLFGSGCPAVVSMLLLLLLLLLSSFDDAVTSILLTYCEVMPLLM